MISIPISLAHRVLLLIIVFSIYLSGCTGHDTSEIREHKEMYSSRLSQDIIVDTIRQAFAGIEYPGDSSIVIPSKFVLDSERKQLRDYFLRRPWNKCSVRDALYFNSASIPCLTPVGYKYYLPAFMLACVIDYDEADLIPETLVNSLIPPVNATNEADCVAFSERIDGLAKDQLYAIKCLLEFLAQEHPEEYASRHVMRAIEYYKNVIR